MPNLKCRKDYEGKNCLSAVRTDKCKGMLQNEGPGRCISSADNSISTGYEIPKIITKKKRYPKARQVSSLKR